jgi:hypothetical protein
MKRSSHKKKYVAPQIHCIEINTKEYLLGFNLQSARRANTSEEMESRERYDGRSLFDGAADYNFWSEEEDE